MKLFFQSNNFFKKIIFMMLERTRKTEGEKEREERDQFAVLLIYASLGDSCMFPK